MRSEELDTKQGAPEEELSAVSQSKLDNPRRSNGNPLTRLINKIGNDPDLTIQLIVIFLTLTSDNLRMDRRIDTMTAKIDAVRNISEVLTNTMRSLKTASQAPDQIRRLLE